MRLQDSILSARPYEIETTDGKLHKLVGANWFARTLGNAPIRFVLDDASVQMVSETAFHERSMVGEALDLLRMPADCVWLEWSDEHAVATLNSNGHISNPQRERQPRKVGILIESDESGRCGEARMLWQNAEGAAELSPFIADFDLNNQSYGHMETSEHTIRHVHIKGLEALDPFFGCVRYRLDPSWEAYYRTYCRNREHFDEVISSGLSTVAGDLPFAAAFLLMLSTRTAFEERPTSLQKLNAKRQKKGRQPLLDHVEIRLNLSGTLSGERGVGRGGSSPRLHHVNGHLVRRADKLFWRRAHLRGNPTKGMVVSKTVNVTANPLPKAA